MAQIVNSITVNGLFNAKKVEFTTLNSDSFSADLKDTKDAVYAFIQLPTSEVGGMDFAFLSADENGKEIKVPLVTTSLNIIPFTTHGIKQNDGTADFKIVSSSGAPISTLGVKVCFIKYSPVVNH